MLSVEHIQKSFGSVQALQDVSFSIGAGSVFGLLGPNGSGKTTTMRILLNILNPDAGHVTWNGKAIDRAMRRRFGYLPEERGLYGKMAVREQIIYFGRLHGLHEPEAAKRADAWIERLEIGTYALRPAAELSKGNQQKVQIACAALHEPELLILDEPFSGLDPVNADILLAVLLDLKTKGTTLVLSSHQMWQLEQLCTAYCVINKGETRATGTLAELRAAWPTRLVRVGPDSQALRGAAAGLGATIAGSENGDLDLNVPANSDFAAMLRTFVGADSIVKFEVVEPSLHDIYLRAIGAAA
uniref:Na+-efflux ABC transporter (ATP-binding protein) n=1 Tax=mine drainage metagenome TaxID=410659 RepID=E6Q6D0_9ZZZZ